MYSCVRASLQADLVVTNNQAQKLYGTLPPYAYFLHYTVEAQSNYLAAVSHRFRVGTNSLKFSVYPHSRWFSYPANPISLTCFD